MTTFSSIHLHGIELNLHLGWPAAEREQRQIILVDLMLTFAKPPKACETDDLDDTYCYDTLVQAVVKQTEQHEFRLIEHLAAKIYHLVKKECVDISSVCVSVFKKPAVANLSGGVTFTYGDKS